MSETEMTTPTPTSVQVAVRIGRNSWVRKLATLHYENSRVTKAEGIDLTQSGPMGLTGIIYVVKDSICRDNRSLLRVERQKLVNGLVVDMQNWGEIEATEAQAA